VVVFFLCGLWHGASWMFVIWGLYHGIWLVLERLARGRLSRIPLPIRWVYTALAILVGWIFFRSTSMPQAFQFLKLMFGLASPDTVGQPVMELVSNLEFTVIPLAVMGCLPIVPSFLHELRTRRSRSRRTALWMVRGMEFVNVVAIIVMLGLSMIFATSANFDPFIYFRF
jgi:alginate O-acetyltransferase complex protein AlgI